MNTNKLVMASLMTCLIIVATMFFKIPVPFGHGYIHAGDSMIFMAVLLLGIRYGAAAAAVGSAMGDVLGGFAIWAPWTFGIKGLMAVLMGLFILIAAKNARNRMIGMTIAGVWMTAGYYAAEGVIYGNWFVALIGIPWNVGQFAAGMAIAVALSTALYKTPARKYFAYQNSQ